MPKYTVENHSRVYDDDTGEYVVVRPDADGLDLVQINYVDESGKEGRPIIMSPKQAKLFAPLIFNLAHELEPEP